MKKNPMKWMLIILIILVVLSIAMQLFWNKKINLASGEVGYFGTEPKANEFEIETVTTAELTA